MCVTSLWRSKLARALVEYETLDLEEVKKVIKGEAIRSIREVLEGDRTGMERASEEEEDGGAAGVVASASTSLAKVARGV